LEFGRQIIEGKRAKIGHKNCGTWLPQNWILLGVKHAKHEFSYKKIKKWQFIP
jgi:hypothetical protein